uniref:Uncharacterized protein n=1 Tax=viral metagenome TaxID=1070528 RepID=A0A6C0DRD7_9ZZZZ
MNTKIIVLFLFLVVINIITIYFSIKEKEPMQSIPLNIGNYLNRYFGAVGIAFYNNRDFDYDDYKIDYDLNYPQNDFCSKLPRKIPFHPEIGKRLSIISEANMAEISELTKLAASWTVNNDSIHIFWKSIKPIVTQTMDDVFKQLDLVKDVRHPVIHFRCSDVPFVLGNQYKFQKYKFYTDLLTKAKSENPNLNTRLVYFLYNNGHNSNPRQQETCDIYYESLCSYLKNNGIDSKNVTESNIDDLAMLFYAPVSISPGSSFSFMAGFFGKGRFYSAGNASHSYDNLKSTCINCDWLINDYQLEHTLIPSGINDLGYYDTADVIQKLYS